MGSSNFEFIAITHNNSIEHPNRSHSKMSLAGSYKKVSFEGLEALLKALEVDAAHFEKASATPLTTEISVDGNQWTIKRIRPNKTVKPGATAKCSTAWDGKVLTIKSTEKDYCHTIEKDGANLKETVTVKGMSATRISS